MRLVQAHYPNAYLDKLSDDPSWSSIWCDSSAIDRADHFEVLVLRGVPYFAPYHLLKDGEVEARVFAEPWRFKSAAEVAKMLSGDSEINAKILAILREKV